MKWIAVLLLSTMPALSQNYLIFVGPTAANARTQAEAISKTKCQQMGCDGTTTVFWWEVICHPTLPQCAVKTEDQPRSDGQDFTALSMSVLQRSTLIPVANLDPTWLQTSVQVVP